MKYLLLIVVALVLLVMGCATEHKTANGCPTAVIEVRRG